MSTGDIQVFKGDESSLGRQHCTHTVHSDTVEEQQYRTYRAVNEGIGVKGNKQSKDVAERVMKRGPK